MTQTTSKARMRNLDKAYGEIKTIDPETSLTKNALRQIFITEEERLCRKVGRLRLVNMDKLLEYLSM